MTKFSRTSSGKYSVQGKTFEKLIGTRAQVWHNTAYKTCGGLTKMDLLMNKHGRIVSKTKHNTAKREKRLVKAGFMTKKGHFGFIKKGSRSRKGGDGSATGVGLPNYSPLGEALSRGGTRRRRGGMNSGYSPSNYNASGGRRRRHKRGGNGVNYSLSPSHISGIKGDSGVDIQFVAGNAA